MTGNRGYLANNPHTWKEIRNKKTGKITKPWNGKISMTTSKKKVTLSPRIISLSKKKLR